jgi:hypothetical protein
MISFPHVFNVKKRYMGISKHQEHDMNTQEIFLLQIPSKMEKYILLSLLKLLTMICLYAKIMLMILYLGLLTKPIFKSLVGSSLRNLRCP